MKNKIEMRAYTAGSAAYTNGQPLQACPVPPALLEEHRAWVRGWMDACACAGRLYR